MARLVDKPKSSKLLLGDGVTKKQNDRTGWRLGDPHPHMPAHGGPIGYNWLMFLLLIPRTETTTTTSSIRPLIKLGTQFYRAQLQCRKL